MSAFSDVFTSGKGGRIVGT